MRLETLKLSNAFEPMLAHMMDFGVHIVRFAGVFFSSSIPDLD